MVFSSIHSLENMSTVYQPTATCTIQVFHFTVFKSRRINDYSYNYETKYPFYSDSKTYEQITHLMLNIS